MVGAAGGCGAEVGAGVGRAGGFGGRALLWKAVARVLVLREVAVQPRNTVGIGR